jgi:hypothetical protein
MDKIIELKRGGLNIRLTSNSWGGPGTAEDYAPLKEGLDRLGENDILSFFAAGNKNKDIDVVPFFPAAFTNNELISVVATVTNDQKAGFSNYGFVGTDVGAPGYNIVSTLPTNASFRLSHESGYGALSGTSMATPMMAGIAALALSRNQSLSANELKTAILNEDSIDIANGLQCSTLGRINANKVVNNPLLFEPRTNNPPTLNVLHTKTIISGDDIFIMISTLDMDGDPLDIVTSSVQGLMTNSAKTNIYIATVPSISDRVLEFNTTVKDNNGGSINARYLVNVLRHSGIVDTDYAIDQHTYFDITNAYSRVCYMPDFGNEWMKYRWQVHSPNSLYYVDGVASTCSYPPMEYLSHAMPTNANLTCGVNFLMEDGGGRKILTPADYYRRGTDILQDKQLPVLNVMITNVMTPGVWAVNYDLRSSYKLNGRITNFIFEDEYGWWSWNIPATGTIVYSKPGNHLTKFYAIDSDSFLVMNTVSVNIFESPPVVDSPPLVQLSAPTRLTCVPKGTKLYLSWADNSTNEDAYVVYIAPTATTSPRVVVLPPNSGKMLYIIDNVRDSVKFSVYSKFDTKYSAPADIQYLPLTSATRYDLIEK